MLKGLTNVFKRNCLDCFTKRLDEVVYGFRPQVFDEGFDFSKQVFDRV